MNRLPLSRDELASLYPSSRVLGMLTNGFQVQEGTLRGIALFLDGHPDPLQLSLVGQHVDESRMGNGHEVLVVDGANVHLLFPARIVPNDQDTKPFIYHPIHDVAAGPMQIMLDLAVALVGQIGQVV